MDLEDGDFIDLDWFDGNRRSHKLAILIHGLGGSSSSNYIIRVGRHLVSSGFRVVAMNLRGASGPNRTTKVYHSGKTDDLDFIFSLVQRQNPDSRIHVAGFSLGGNALLKWLGENPHQQIVFSAAAVSVPFDLSAVASRLNQGLSSIYRDVLLRNLRGFLRSRDSDLSSVIDLNAAYAAKTFHQYDDAVTAPLSGFANAEDYYSKCSSVLFLPRISTPALIIHSRDDPFTNEEIIPERSRLSKSVLLELSDHGGHVGFVAKGSGLSTHYYLPERLTRYFQSFST